MILYQWLLYFKVYLKNMINIIFFYTPSIAVNALKSLKQRQRVLRSDVVELRKKFEHYLDTNRSIESEVKPQLIRSQLKTINKMIRRHRFEKKENLQQFEQEIEGLKQLIAKYFPRFALEKL